MATPSKSRPVFDEDDDTDSVNTDSTIESDLEAEYSVEKREIDAGHAKPFKVATYEAALRRDEEQRERRYAKRAEKRRLRKSRGPTPRRRLLTKKELTKKGTARKAPTRDATSTSSSATGNSPREQTTSLFEPSGPSKPIGLKRKRLSSNARSTSPVLSVDDVANSQYSVFNEHTESPRKLPSSHSTTVPKRPRVDDPSAGKAATKQKSGAATTVVTSRPKSSNASSVQKKSQLNGEVSQAAESKEQGTERARKEAMSGSSDPQTTKLAKPPTAAGVSKVPVELASRRASDVIAKPTESTDGLKNKQATATNTDKSQTAVSKDRPEPAASSVAKTVPKPVVKPAGPSRRPISMFIEPKAKPRQRPRVNEYTLKDLTDPQFVNLSMQRRMQLYSHNEPPPDPNALTFIDPNTGKAVNNTDGTSSASTALRLDTNVASTSETERSAVLRSAPALESRSASTSGSHREAPQGRHTTATPWSAQGTEPRFAYPSARPHVPHIPRKQIACRFWMKGTCNRSDEGCYNAHTWTGQLAPKSASTCKFWANGKCTYSDEECEYYHSYDFPRNADAARQEGLEDVNGFHAMQQARHRSESPDRYGLRQDEAEVRRGRADQLRSRPDERTPIQSPSLTSTTSFEPRRDLHTGHTTMAGLADEPPSDVAHTLTSTTVKPDMSNEMDTGNPVDICLGIKPTSQPTCTMDVKLVFDTRASRIKFLDVVGEKSSLESSEICRSRDFESYWFSKENAWASGGVVYTPGDTVAAYLEDFLVLQSSCFAIRNDKFIFVVYSTQNPDWKFMPHRGPDRSGLRWYLQAAPNKSSFISMCYEHLELNPEILFAGNRGKHAGKVVYLAFPRGTPETKLVEVFLNEVGAKFVYSEDCDLWTQVVLFHPSMNAFWKIPEFWNVGVSKSIKLRPDSPIKYNCTRLFPSGTLTLVTDDVFKHDPAHALQVLKIYEGYKMKPEGGRTDRIYCRPGILAWLAELIDEERETGNLAEDSPRVKCWQLVCELLGTPVADNSRNPFRSDMKPPAMLYSPPKSEMPEYGPLWDGSEEEATDYLVNWFAGHAIEECENYRRFNVLYEHHGALSAQTPGLIHSENPKDPKEWMKKYTHIKITTPARFIVQVENYEKSKLAHR
ncbi:hypothetical protein M436DRAFT_69743 [Aureobasidium namibiae CBS 147.97]|uniref:C3H1-type domain-containing protein n=1 Tax=Aureobasidium namibiae CBS 147.97 TaxID=1043004 RepID=A0A074WUF8_9PEZI|nr:uncharacterized protein M436DRAFT_69743 [Aureobasidium namibiae CBS 147.97]KEQ76803.1 hypothetical protein M436DRAFT_69743 [Aureobasidium namibiae CBS 147.97]